MYDKEEENCMGGSCPGLKNATSQQRIRREPRAAVDVTVRSTSIPNREGGNPRSSEVDRVITIVTTRLIVNEEAGRNREEVGSMARVYQNQAVKWSLHETRSPIVPFYSLLPRPETGQSQTRRRSTKQAARSRQKVCEDD